MVVACDVGFTPDVALLILEEAPDQSFTDEFSPQEVSPEELEQEPATDVEPVNKFTPADALAQCGDGLSWGDELMGMCLAPGGDSYFVWTEEGSVIRVNADATDITQGIFQQAARDRASALSEIKAQGRSVIFESAGFLIALIAAVPACATVVGCAVDGAALVTTGGLLADSGTSIVDNLKLGESATKRADYAYCRMTGESDARCRESAGITDEIDGG